MSTDAWAQVAILLACGPGVVVVDCCDRFCTLGRAPRTKKTLPDFREWCRVTRHPLVFRRLTGCQRTPRFWGITVVSHLCKVDDISKLQSRSKYIPKGCIPSSLNLSIGESFSIAPKTEAVPLTVGVLKCLGLNLVAFEDSGISSADVSTGVLTTSTIGFSSIFKLYLGIFNLSIV